MQSPSEEPPPRRVAIPERGDGLVKQYHGLLLGLADWLAVLDGRLAVEGPADGGTLVAAAIPLAG